MSLPLSNRVLLLLALLSALGAVPAWGEKTVLVPFDAAKWGASREDGRGSVSGTKIRKVVHYEYSLGGHSHINSRNALTRLAQKYGFALEQWTAQADVTPSNLLGVSVFVANNGEGDVFQPRNSPYDSAIRAFVEAQGGGLLTLHDAASYVPCPTSGTENLSDPNCRWLARVMVRQYLHQETDQTRVRIYADSVMAGEIPPDIGTSVTPGTGANVPAAISHGRRNPQTRMIFENLPINGAGPDSALRYVWDGVGDEWKSHRGYVRQQGAQVFDGVEFGPVIALLSIDESKYTSSLKMGDRVQSWTRTVGNGVAAHSTMGHSNVWTRTRTGGVLGTSVVNDSFPEKYTWRLMKYLARDFVGCTNPAYAEYNPEASVEIIIPGFDPNPCNSVVSLKPGAKPVPASFRATIRDRRIFIDPSRTGAHRIHITNVNGRGVFSAVSHASGDAVRSPVLRPGLYLVRVTGPAGASSARRVLVN